MKITCSVSQTSKANLISNTQKANDSLENIAGSVGIQMFLEYYFYVQEKKKNIITCVFEIDLFNFDVPNLKTTHSEH